MHVVGQDDVYSARTSKVGSLLHYVIACLGHSAVGDARKPKHKIQAGSQLVSQLVSPLFGHVEFRHLFNRFSWQQLRSTMTLRAVDLLN